MKNVVIFLLLLCSAFSLIAQQKMSCCGPSSTDAFSQLASDREFVKSHPLPLPFTYRSENGKAIVFRAADGTEAYGWEIKAKSPTNNYLFVIHEWWGLNDYIKQESEKLWADLGNINVIALDLYDKKVATTREDAAKYMQAASSERIQSIIRGAINYAGSNARIFTIGWCFGGGWSLQSSIMAGKQGAGCVMYYGMPEKDIEKLKSLNGDVLGIFGNKDQWINPNVVDAFAADMNKADKKLVLKRYDADHGFANPSNPIYDKSATEDAYKYTLAFLRAKLG
jgi:carboxymethylenebutenolidase